MHTLPLSCILSPPLLPYVSLSQTPAHPGKLRQGWAELSPHMWCLSRKHCLGGFRNKPCVLVTPVGLELQESRGPLMLLSNCCWGHTSPMPRVGAHQVPCSVQEELHEGLEDEPDILPLKIERQRDVCRTQLRNGTYKTGRWLNHSHWSWNRLASQGQLKHRSKGQPCSLEAVGAWPSLELAVEVPG